MILQFPDLDTLHLVLAGHVVEPAVVLAPATLSFDAEGRPAIEPSVDPSKAALENLKKLGITRPRKHAGAAIESLATWLQALPLVRDSATPMLSAQAPVLFELTNADDLPTLVREILRLGNDRQSYRWIADPANPDQPRVLLRVIGPPYYTLLRALDRDSSRSVRGYLERSPRVWVEIGSTHPFAGQVRVAEGQSVLLRSPRSWQFLDDAPFHDVYDLLRFELPSHQIAWEASTNPTRIEVPLRLALGSALDVPEFWVLRDNPIDQLDSFVRDSVDSLVSRLMFSIATDDRGNTLAVLRTRPSKHAPPILSFENAIGFKQYYKLPNLYVPVSRRLHPQMRRDAVRHLLANDPERVVWLMPTGESAAFTPMSLADGAFRALEDWVDYVIDREQEPLAAWIESTQFEFDSFICKDGESRPPTDPGVGKAPMPREVKPEVLPSDAPSALAPTDPLASSPSRADPFKPREQDPGEWRKKRKAIEDEFLSLEGTLDSQARQVLWPSLAAANAGAGDATEASICWLNAMWTMDEPLAEWVAGWARSERPDAHTPMTAEEFDRRLRQENPTPGDARALSAGFLELAVLPLRPEWLSSRLPTLQDYLVANERLLPLRAAWLVGLRIAHLTGSDLLGLARLRDRLLQRLLEVGLSPERDLPGFLRYSDSRNMDRLRAVKDKILDLHAVVRKWTEHIPVNLPYIDLEFAFALARLGEVEEARHQLEAARNALQVAIPLSGDIPIKLAVVKNALFTAFEHRIEEAIAGRPHRGSLPPQVQTVIEAFAAKSRSSQMRTAFSEADYTIAKLRQHSQVLEPQERLNAYSSITRKSDPFEDELASLGDIRDVDRLATQVRKLYQNGVAGRRPEASRVPLLRAALPLAPRVGEAFVEELLDLTSASLTAAEAAGKGAESQDDLRDQGELLERSLQLAGLYERHEWVPKLVDRFLALVLSKSKDETRFELIHRVTAHCLRSLKKFHFSGEIDRLLGRLQTDVIRSTSSAELRRRYPSDTLGKTWSQALQSLVHIAGGWLMYGVAEKAVPILDEARSALIGKAAVAISPQYYAGLASAYISAIGHGPFQSGIERLLEFFQSMDRTRITNTTSTAASFSRHHLEMVEALVWSLVSDDFVHGQSGRRWLDDDEYLVRRRIHRDLRRVLE